MTVKIGTRRSPLALAQTTQTAEALASKVVGTSWELQPIQSTGDRIQDRALRDAGGKGLFVKELDEALLDRRIDCAVHSLKDVPSDLPEGIAIAAVLERASAVDCLVSRDDCSLESLEPGSRLGTTSPRRAAQALLKNPSLEVALLRGSVSTRLDRVREGDFDATFLARAGLDRLGIEVSGLVVRDLAAEDFLPSVGQGAIAVTVRSGDADALALWSSVEHHRTRAAVDAERAFARVFGGGCHLPIAGHAKVSKDRVRLEGMVVAPDGSRSIRDSIEGPADDAQSLGCQLGERVLNSGGDAILAQAEASA